MTAVIAIARKSTTEKETATTTLVAEAEAQGAKIEDGAGGVEVSQIAKAEVVNLVSIGITGLQRDREEAGAVAAITRENPATITLVDEILQAAIQTGFDIRQTLNAAYDWSRTHVSVPSLMVVSWIFDNILMFISVLTPIASADLSISNNTGLS